MQAMTILSTEHIQPREVVSYWNDVVSKVYAPCHNILFKNDFHARTEITGFGLTELSHIVSHGVDYRRTQENIRRDQKDDIFISVMLQGVGYFTQFDRQVKQCEGDILIHDSAYPYCYQYPNGYRSIFYKIPRVLLEARLPRIDKLGGTVIPKGSPYAKAIGSFLHSAYVVGTDSNMDCCTEFAEPITTLLSTCLRHATSQSNGYTNDTRHEVLLSHIKAFMQENLRNDALDLKTIAEQQHISVRTLNRLFAEVGETPMRWLQSQRLARAHQMLITMPQSSITDIALKNGFNELSHFSRLFRRHFGQPPRMLRAESLEQSKKI